MSSEIQPADERFRTRLLIVLTLVSALGAAGILRLDSYLNGLHDLTEAAQSAAMANAWQIVRLILALLATGGVLFSFYLGRVSWQTIRDERYPPPGARVLSDTRIQRGPQARRRGQAGLALALLTLMLTAATVTRANQVFSRLLEIHLTPTRVDGGPPNRPNVPTEGGQWELFP